MYLTIRQHEKLRTLIMDIEIPYRSYISQVMLQTYKSEVEFSAALDEKLIALKSTSEWATIASEAGRLRKNSTDIFFALQFSNQSFNEKKVKGEAIVPMLGQVNTLSFIFKDLFQELISQFPDFKTFYSLARKYQYDRNKLDHPMCKVLEDTDMTPVLNFIDILCSSLDENFFWVKPFKEIRKELISLQTGRIFIPIEINNINDMPFPDMRIVCRTREIERIKEFVYGKPGAFRKQSSYCIFGYGGLGKTALVLEAIKEIVQDVLDSVTINGYHPKFVLFYTAKEQKLSYSVTAGNIESISVRQTYSSFKDFKTQFFRDLGIESFDNFKKEGIVIVDNLETLSSEDRSKLHDFIQAGSPAQIQYILTSRKEEQYDMNIELHGFENEAGFTFIGEYMVENDLAADLSQDNITDLLQLSKGNTLVLVLCLRRLGQNLATMESMKADFSKLPKIRNIDEELRNLPPNGFEIISEFMFKNTFEEIEEIFSKDTENIYRILQVFAVYESNNVDIYTLSLITTLDYKTIEEILSILCHYLILERHGASYSQNQFAAKYIVQRFLPDSVKYMSLQNEIVQCTRKIARELKDFNEGLMRNPERRTIFADWQVITDGDKIAAAKADQIFLSVKDDCKKGNKFFVETGLQEALKNFEDLERTTMHPYIKYQKARILKQIDDCGVLDTKYDDEITEIYKEVIWGIKINGIYDKIQKTKTYASILWIYGMRLSSSDYATSARYLEDAKESFERLSLQDNEYYACITQLTGVYINLYKTTKEKSYLRQARQLDNLIYNARKGNHYFWELHDELKRYGQY